MDVLNKSLNTAADCVAPGWKAVGAGVFEGIPAPRRRLDLLPDSLGWATVFARWRWCRACQYNPFRKDRSNEAIA